MEEGLINFDLPVNQSSIIKVIGVGGAGGNAVEHMFNEGIKGVDYIICNTDNQALEKSQIPIRIPIGKSGLGAGSRPEIGKQAAIDAMETITEVLSSNTKMLFVTAGMGGGTGTGAAPVVAEIAKGLGILTVGIVTTPYSYEGPQRRKRAEDGIAELKKYVDALIVISNDKLRELYGSVPLSQAFSNADNVLTMAARSIAEIITVGGSINLDFEDVNTVMRNSGSLMMGYGEASGENRAINAVAAALESPLLNESSIKDTGKILLYVMSGKNELTQEEVDLICDTVQEEAGNKADLFFGYGYDETLDYDVSITLIAAGINGSDNSQYVNYESLYTEKSDLTPKSNISQGTPINNENKEFKEANEEIEKIELSMFNFDEIEKEIGSMNGYTQNKAENRIEKLKGLSLELGDELNPENIEQFEKEPAYKRKNIVLEEVDSSSALFMSGTSLNSNNDLVKNKANSFIHPAVD